jgi:hypothetical protein
MSSIPELFELVNALYQLGQELPHYLLVLSELAEPNLSQDHRTPILCKLFEEVPRLLSNITPLEFHKLIANVPQDAVTLRMLVNLYNISTTFQQLSCLQILQLTNNVIPPGPLSMQLEMLLVAQEHMRAWTADTPGQLHDELANTSLELERKRLLELQPKLPWELLQFFMEIIKLPKNESLDFFKWFIQLKREQVFTLVQILQFEPIIILEYKRRLTLPSSNINNTHPPPENTHVETPETPMNSNLDNIEDFMLQPSDMIGIQCPFCCSYVLLHLLVVCNSISHTYTRCSVGWVKIRALTPYTL